jgi:hypothetical protein
LPINPCGDLWGGHNGGVDGGAEGNRTPDLLIANEALSQLSYSPIPPHTQPVRRGRKMVT